MKIRIKENSIRFRLAQREVEQLSQKQSVKNITQFSPLKEEAFIYSLHPSFDLDRVSASLGNRSISISVSEKRLLNWAKTDLISLEAFQAIGNGEQLYILIEKDFKCLTDRPNEDESGLYPHPEEKHLKC